MNFFVSFLLPLLSTVGSGVHSLNEDPVFVVIAQASTSAPTLAHKLWFQMGSNSDRLIQVCTRYLLKLVLYFYRKMILLFLRSFSMPMKILTW